MTWISKSVTVIGGILLAHACYSAQEHTALQSFRATAATLTSSSPAAPSLPIDIAIETVVATVAIILGLVLSSRPLRPIHWSVWAGKIEREGEEGFLDNSGEVNKDFVGNPFRIYEARPGFIDIRKQKKEFADTLWYMSCSNATSLSPLRCLDQHPDNPLEQRDPESIGPPPKAVKRNVNRDTSLGTMFRLKLFQAMHDTLDETLYLEEDVAMSGLEAAETLVLRVQPTTIIVPDRAPDPLIELLERDAHRLDEGASSGENGTYVFRHLGSAEFDYDTGREHLADLDLGPHPPDALEVFPVEDVPAKCLNSSKHAKLTRLSESVNLDSLLSIGCAGAVLNDVERRRVAENSFSEDGGTVAFRVRSIKNNTPENIMLILRAELDPNPQTQFNNTSEARFKESLSVYGLFQSLACTSQGKARLRQMLFRPSTDIGVIQERQQAIGVLLRPENRETAIKEAVASLSGSSKVALFSKGASQTLDGLKAEFARICQMLPEANAMVRREAPPWATKHIRYCTVLPELGFLVAVTLDSSTGEGFYLGRGAADGPWDPSFVNGDLVYYKNALMLDLDAQFGDLPSRIAPNFLVRAEEEIEVMMELAATVLQYEDSITSASDLFGELDSMIALTMAAEKYKWAAPQMTCANVVEIVDGRHPLQELLVPTFIPNNCSMEGGHGTGDLGEMEADAPEDTAAPSMLVLTGPNNSGKSVYMRQVAITVFLAHIDSYVPATLARIGITDRILTRIATRETVADDESAFMVDLKQAAFTLNFGTRRSLILADEFGKGTSTETGAALFVAYLVHFLDLGAERPKVLAGTHFHDIFERGIIEPGKGVDFVHMAVHLEPNATDPEDQVTFLFQLAPGRSTASLGVMCAAMNDVDTNVIKRAQNLVHMQGGMRIWKSCVRGFLMRTCSGWCRQS
ncbi:muts domain V-domain-containing protein [Schizothecium vesticola]|uniref:DNA mismatch repair protein MSH5 n=1 Tax=Schizothecium vesticola TaxID=314040 RepID=A0AA40FB74_9PEZI|nr:muts domain V-domain-containing protein [Schizothecium vesticola]